MLNRILSVLLLVTGLQVGNSGVAADGNSTQALARDYLQLSHWAAAHGVRPAWNARSRQVVVAGPGIQIVLHLDACRIEFNGVGVWLSRPVVAAGGQVLVASQDARGVLNPLMHPPRVSPEYRIRTICLDPGHGGKEPGQQWGQRLEKQFTLALALELRNRLVADGFRVVLTRSDDRFVELTERTAIARRNGADLFVSLHYNATGDRDTDIGGVEVYAMTPEGARSTNADGTGGGSLDAAAGNGSDPQNLVLAYCVQRSLLRELPNTPDRGVRRARFLVLRLAEMPAVLIEAGFMSNPADARWIYSVTGRRKAATAIAEGIREYWRRVEWGPGTLAGSSSPVGSDPRKAGGRSNSRND